jgi:hypothetical protein
MLNDDRIPVINAMFAYLEAEHKRFTEGRVLEAPTSPLLASSTMQGFRIEHDKLIGRLHPDHGEYIMDPSAGMLFQLVRCLGGIVQLNPSRSPGGEYLHLVPEVSFPKIRAKVSVYRLLLDARPGQKVMEAADDHHNLLPEALRVTYGVPGNLNPSKYRYGRTDFIGMCIRQASSVHDAGSEAPASSRDIEMFLRTLWLVADWRTAVRALGTPSA